MFLANPQFSHQEIEDQQMNAKVEQLSSKLHSLFNYYSRARTFQDGKQF